MADREEVESQGLKAVGSGLLPGSAPGRVGARAAPQGGCGT